MSLRRTTLVVAALLVLGACGGKDTSNDARADEPAAAEAAGSEAVVTIHTFDFQPDPITVKTGTTITFHNDDKILHTVTSGTREAPNDAFAQGKLDGAGSEYEVTLDEPGTYDYFCSIHPGQGMTGTIIVEG
jgi:plastocyanin